MALGKSDSEGAIVICETPDMAVDSSFMMWNLLLKLPFPDPLFEDLFLFLLLFFLF